MGDTPARAVIGVALVVLCASAGVARADDPPTVRAIIDKSNPARLLLDRELPAGQEFILELVGATADDQAVVTVQYKEDCASTTRGAQRHELAMVPVTTNNVTVQRATIPRLQIRKQYCVAIALYGGLPPAVLDSVTDEAMASARSEVQGAVRRGALEALIAAQVKASIEPQLVARAMTSEEQTAAAVAQAAVNAFDISTEAKAVRDARADVDAKAEFVHGAPAGQGGPAVVGTALGLAAAHQALDAALAADAARLIWPGGTYNFVVGDQLVAADRAWVALDRADYRAAVQAQLDARLRDRRYAVASLQKWRDELARTTGARPAVAPPLAGERPVDVWLSTRRGQGPPDFVRVEPTLTSQALTPAEWASAASQLRSLAAALTAPALAPALATSRTSSTSIADAIDLLVAADRAHTAAAAALAVAQATYATARTAAETRLRGLLLATLQQRRFQLSSGRAASGLGTTNNINNWVSLNAGVALAAPITRTEGSDDRTFHGWLVPYFAVNIHAPQERTIPPGDLVDGFWQRVCLTGGVLLTTPDPIDGHAIEPVLFSRAALLAVGVRVTPYSRVAIGSLFFRVQDHPDGGDPSLGLAPFIGYSLDIDAVKLVKDGFGGM